MPARHVARSACSENGDKGFARFVARGSTVQIGQLLYDLPLIGKVLAYAAAAAGQVKV